MTILPVTVVVAVLALAVAATIVVVRSRDADADAFVTRSGRQFLLAGKPFSFVGFNLYDAAASDLFSCRPASAMTDDQLDSALAWAHDEAGARVLRVWAYRTYTDSGRDYSGVDRVLGEARRHGLKVLMVLEDGPGDCTDDAGGRPKSAFQGDTWYTTGYKQANGTATISYREYVTRIVSHYRSDPTVFGWSMMNEAETDARDAQGRSALVDFAQDVGALIHSVDRRHLVTLGSQSNGAPGASGSDFRNVYDLPQLDFAEVHDWPRSTSDTAVLPGGVNGDAPPAADADECRGSSAPVACSFAIAALLGKPLVVGEAGIAASDDASRQRRADVFAAKMQAAFAAGASGYLVWQLNQAMTDGYDVIAGSNDPVAATLRSRARQLSS